MELKAFFVILCSLKSLDASLWGYAKSNGPITWGEDNEVCAAGNMQSPVDLHGMRKPRSGKKDIDEPIFFSENFWEAKAEGELFNNGHTVEFKVDMPNEFSFRGGPFGEEEYQFLQLHFHWGSNDKQGSEHTIRGKRFPMEMHMVCINSKYVETDGTLDDEYTTAADGVAVLGFLFNIGKKDNAQLQNITEGISSLSKYNETQRSAEEEASIPVELNLGSFIDSVLPRGYFTYNGSFTTPGCNEVVTWVNFKKPLKISKYQLAIYRSLKDTDGNTIADNFRPTQDLNGRTIKVGGAIAIDSESP